MKQEIGFSTEESQETKMNSKQVYRINKSKMIIFCTCLTLLVLNLGICCCYLMIKINYIQSELITEIEKRATQIEAKLNNTLKERSIIGMRGPEGQKGDPGQKGDLGQKGDSGPPGSKGECTKPDKQITFDVPNADKDIGTIINELYPNNSEILINLGSETYNWDVPVQLDGTGKSLWIRGNGKSIIKMKDTPDTRVCYASEGKKTSRLTLSGQSLNFGIYSVNIDENIRNITSLTLCPQYAGLFGMYACSFCSMKFYYTSFTMTESPLVNIAHNSYSFVGFGQTTIKNEAGLRDINPVADYTGWYLSGHSATVGYSYMNLIGKVSWLNSTRLTYFT